MLWRLVVTCVVLPTFATNASQPLATATMSGAAFLMPSKLQQLPDVTLDQRDPYLSVQRLLPNHVNSKAANACNLGTQADKTKCLNVEGRECMWVMTEGTDPFAAIQPVEQHCMPCEVDGTDIPCWNVGALVGGMKVLECSMRCAHQKRIREPEYTCSDSTGFISGAECFDRASKSGSKCMYLAYEVEKDGGDVAKATCAPCHLKGVGGWGCPEVGSTGPEPNSKVTSCESQCDEICPGPPDCPTTIAPPPPPPNPAPGVAITSLHGDPTKQMLRAPIPIEPVPVNPYAIAEAAKKAAEAAGWQIGTPPPPVGYMPVIMYRSPVDYLMTPPPPPEPSVPPPTLMPPPGAMMMTSPPPSLLQEASVRRPARSAVASFRNVLAKIRQGRGQ
mmetsp:Transcript_53106/g.141257  ORF Transcript_53106/g.141257 Transcript_53106/m.141257 type:complete len:389 (+) Transcript_53106:148-1314(+)